MARKLNFPFEGEAITAKQLAERWDMSYETIKNYIYYYPHLVPTQFRVKGMKRSRVYFSLNEVEEFEKVEGKT